MDKKKFLKLLAEIFETNDKINEKTKLSKYNYDSLAVLELIVVQEKHFKKLNIDTDKYLQCQSVGDILKLFKIE